MGEAVEIRAVGLDERAAWEPLWKGYQAFYKVTHSDETNDVTWRRLHDDAEPMYLIGADVDGKLCGIVHYLFHRSTWAINDYCYLQDLFVAPDVRGRQLGRRLIEAVFDKARERKVGRVYWLTHDTNYRGRELYDKVAENAGYIQYRKAL
jgi:GNAT superfamily N-acetyltransferase